MFIRKSMPSMAARRTRQAGVPRWVAAIILAVTLALTVAAAPAVAATTLVNADGPVIAICQRGFPSHWMMVGYPFATTSTNQWAVVSADIFRSWDGRSNWTKVGPIPFDGKQVAWQPSKPWWSNTWHSARTFAQLDSQNTFWLANPGAQAEYAVLYHVQWIEGQDRYVWGNRMWC